MKKLSITLSLLLAMSYSLFASIHEISFKDIANEADWQESLAAAQANQKAIFVMVHTSWCGYCRKMERDVYTKSKVYDFHNQNFINVRIDGESNFGLRFGEQYQVQGFPGILFLNGEGGLLQQETGYLPGKALLSMGEESILMLEKMNSWSASFQQGKLSNSELKIYAKLLAQQGELAGARKVAHHYFDKNSSIRFSDPNELLFASQLANDFMGTVYTKVIAQRKSIPTEHFTEYLQAVYDRSLAEAIQQQDFKQVEQLVNKLLPELLNENNQSELPVLALMTKASYYGQLGDATAYTTLIEGYYKEKQQGNAEFLFDQAYHIIKSYDAPALFDISIRWIDEAIKLDGKRFSFYMVKAYAYGAKEDFKKGIELANEALKLAQDKQEKRIAEQAIEDFNEALAH